MERSSWDVNASPSDGNNADDGRAGRPKYDNVGESWLLAKGREEEEKLVSLYLHGEPEEVTSKLANPNAMRAEEDPALLTHVLSMLATGGISDRDALVVSSPKHS